MRIGVVTYWNSSDNYGQQLQCWAMQRILKRLGHNPFLIRYSRQWPWSFTSCFKWILSRKTISRIVRKSLKSHRENANQSSLKDKLYFYSYDILRDFETFRREHIVTSDRIWKSIDDLRKHPPLADCYLAGSDQVWHDSLMESDAEGMYLAFGDAEIRRVSYAASIGRDIPSLELDRFTELVKAFNHVSVRERDASKLCERIGIHAQVVLDPTFLITEHDIEQLRIKSREAYSQSYMFCYFLNVKEFQELHWSDVQSYLKNRKLGIDIVYSSGYEPAKRLVKDIEPSFPTVQEWVAKIANSTCVYTTSYHGLVFALLFHKPFVVLPLMSHPFANDRMMTLLDALGLSSRMLQFHSDFAQIMDSIIDWNSVDLRLDELRQDSISFLKTALESEGNT